MRPVDRQARSSRGVAGRRLDGEDLRIRHSRNEPKDDPGSSIDRPVSSLDQFRRRAFTSPVEGRELVEDGIVLARNIHGVKDAAIEVAPGERPAVELSVTRLQKTADRFMSLLAAETVEILEGSVESEPVDV